MGGVPKLLDAVRRILELGVDWIQVREKHLEAGQLLDVTCRIIELARPASVKVLVNTRADVAMVAGADGLHLPGNSIPVKSWRAVVPENWLVGVSTHSAAEAVEAERAGAGYVLLSPVFRSLSKPGYGPPLGLNAVAAVAGKLRIPLLALGGVNSSNAASCVRAGAAGVAGISLFQG